MQAFPQLSAQLFLPCKKVKIFHCISKVFTILEAIYTAQGCLQNCLGDSVREKEKTEMRTALPFSHQPLLGSTLSRSL